MARLQKASHTGIFFFRAIANKFIESGFQGCFTAPSILPEINSIPASDFPISINTQGIENIHDALPNTDTMRSAGQFEATLIVSSHPFKINDSLPQTVILTEESPDPFLLKRFVHFDD